MIVESNYLDSYYFFEKNAFCRFINADNYELISELSSVAGQLNLYAYANNNPIMYTDESGELILTLTITFAISAVFSAGTSIITQLVTTGDVNWGSVGLSALFGGLSGVLALTGVGGVIGQFFLQGALSAGQTIAETAIFNTWDQFSIEGLILDFALSGALGTIGAKGANREFKRILQIEKSLTHVLKRDFAKNGFNGLVKTWRAKSSKYVKEIVVDRLSNSFRDAATSFAKHFIV